MSKLSLTKLLYTGLFTGIAVVFSISGFAIWQNSTTSKLINDMHEYPFITTNTAMDIRSNVRLLWEINTKAAYQDVLPNDVNKQIADIENNIDKDFAILKMQYLGNKSDVEDIEKEFSKLKLLTHKAVELKSIDGAKRTAKYLEANEAEKTYKLTIKEINDVIGFAKSKALEFKKQANEMHEQEIRNNMLFSMFVLLLGAIVGLIMMRYIRKEFAEIEHAVESIKNDKYQKMPTSANGLEEFVNLKEAINLLVESISKSRRTIEDKNEEVIRQNSALMEKSREVEEINVELDTALEEANQANESLMQQARALGEMNTELDSSYEELARTSSMLELRTKELEANETRLRISQNAAKLATWEYYFETNAFVSSDEMIKIFDIDTGEQPTILQLKERIHLDDADDALKAYEDAIVNLKNYADNYRVIAKDGSVRYVHSQAMVAYDENGTALRLVGTLQDVTELQKINEENLALKQKYQLLFNDSPDAYLIMEIDGGTIIDCNRASEIMLRGERSQLLGLTPDDVSPLYQPSGELSKDAVKSVIDECMQEGKNRFEWMHKRLDGEEFWAEVNISLVELGGRKALFVAWRDIAERKDLETTLQKQKEEFETIFRTSKDGIAILDMQTNFLDFNDTYLEMTGFTREELLAKSCVGLSVPEDIPHAREVLKEVIEKGFVRNFEKTCIVKDDKRVTINMAISLMPDKKRLLISTKDVTSWKTLENKLEKERAFLRGLLEAIPDVVFFKDKNSIYLGCNKQFTKMFGIAETDFIGKSDFDLFDEEKAKLLQEIDVNIIKNKTIGFNENHLVVDNKDIYLETIKAPFYDENHEVAGIIGISRDATLLKNAITELGTLNASLEQKIEEETSKRLEQEKLLQQQSKMGDSASMETASQRSCYQCSRCPDGIQVW
jgi:PAS domain S-box-containing protein